MASTIVNEQQGPAASPLRRRLHALAAQHAVPLTAVIEVTRRCNLHCVHCYVSAGKNAELSTLRLVRLVDELSEAGAIAVSLTGGELTLRDGWRQVAARVRQHCMMLTIMTNGTLLSPDDCRFIAELRPTRVCVSLYAADAALHDEITGVNGSFAASVRTVRQLRRLGVRTRLGSVMLKENVTQVSALRRMAESLGCEFLFDPTVQPCDDGSRSVFDHRVDAEVLEAFYRDEVIAKRSKEGRVAFAKTRLAPRVPRNCGAGTTSAFIDATGDVYACMGFVPSFGNVGHEAFQAVWTGDAARSHREAMQRPLVQCEACELKDYCTARCTRLALVEDGDISGPSARACELAGLIRRLRQSSA